MNRLCTIIALNYLPQAMALLDSSRNIHPDSEFYVLITDAKTDTEVQLEGATVLLPEDLKLSPEWLADMRSYYDPVELATSLKPFLLKTLLTNNIDSVTFLDPDIVLFSDLAEGFSMAKNSGIALTPHRLTPSNIHNSNFSELAFLQYGIFNLGYISVGQKALQMLEWWGERLHWYCTRFPYDVVFTDQKWMNFVPAFFEFEVVRNPGYDLAPWNLDERPLSRVGEKYFAGERPLVFIHFSQMSGGLASGKKTNLWEKCLEFSENQEESLKIITDLTDKYSNSLVQYRQATNAIHGSSNSGVPSQTLSIHHRKKLIQQSINASRALSEVTPRHIRKEIGPEFLRKLIATLERSSTLNGARAGFKQDLPKVSQRLRNLFHK